MAVAEPGGMKAVLLALLASGALAGCMIGDTTGPGPGGGSGAPDAHPGGGGTPDAPAAATCTVGSDLGSLGALAGATPNWDMTAQAVASDTCKTNVGTASMSGTVVYVSGGGGGNGGGGGGGSNGGTGPSGI